MDSQFIIEDVDSEGLSNAGDESHNILETIISEIDIGVKHDVPLLSCDDVKLDVNHVKETLLSICGMLQQKAMVDLTLHCGDEQFQVHRVVLAAHSQFFYQVLMNVQEVENYSIISLDNHGIKPSDLQHILEYIYTGKIPPNDEYEALLLAAEKLQVSALKKRLEDLIKKKPQPFKEIKKHKNQKEEDKVDVKPERRSRTRQQSKRYSDYVTDDVRKKPRTGEKNMVSSSNQEEASQNQVVQCKDETPTDVHEAINSKGIEVFKEGSDELLEDYVGSLQEKPPAMKAEVEDPPTVWPAKLRCQNCSYVAGDVESLLNHIAKAHPDIMEKRVTCPICDQTFKQHRYLRAHVQRLHKFDDMNPTYTCEECGVPFTKELALKKHKRTHGIACPKCSEVLKTESEAREHFVQKHPNEELKCEECSFTCNDPISLNNHKTKKHVNARSHLCDTCGKSFSSIHALKHHVSTVHGESKFQCSHCSYKASTKFCLVSHMARQHNLKLDGSTAEPKFTCDKCDFSCFTRVEIKLHALKHEGLKPHKCPVCDFETTEKGTLTKHVRLHTGEKPYQCNICDMRFSHPSGLSRHRITHTGIKPYQCQLCPKAFIKKSSLDAHAAVHTAVATMRCPLCSFYTLRRSSLVSHMHKLHSSQPERPVRYRKKVGDSHEMVPIQQAPKEQPVEVVQVLGSHECKDGEKAEDTVNYVYENSASQVVNTVYAFDTGYAAATNQIVSQEDQPQMTILYNMDGHLEYAPIVMADPNPPSK